MRSNVYRPMVMSATYNTNYDDLSSFFADAQLPQVEIATVWFDRLVLLDPVGASWDTIGAEHVARDAVKLLTGAGILEIVRPAAMLSVFAAPFAPMALAKAVLGVVRHGNSGVEWLLGWRAGRKSMQESGLHYFVENLNMSNVLASFVTLVTALLIENVNIYPGLNGCKGVSL
jgi:hypothetical protein